MEAKDMTYAGETLSSRGLMIASFDGSSSVETIDSDSQKTFTSVSMFYGKYQPFVFTSYEDRLVMEFTIIKDPCKFEEEDLRMTQQEVRSIKRWLNRPTPHVLRFDDEQFADVFWEGSFNVTELYLAGVTYGLQLSFQCNRPFGLQDAKTYEGSLITGGCFIVNDSSDEEGHIYPTLEVTCLESGDLQLNNQIEDRTTIVKNCVVDEKIIFFPNLQIRSSVGTHELGDDFNYKFLRICNTYDDTVNKITTSIPIEYKLTYNPIAKVVIA